MPPALLTWYATMLPRIRAQEELRMIALFAAASGTMPKSEQRQYLNALEREQGGGQRQRSVKATPEMLRSIGIAVEEVPV